MELTYVYIILSRFLGFRLGSGRSGKGNRSSFADAGGGSGGIDDDDDDNNGGMDVVLDNDNSKNSHESKKPSCVIHGNLRLLGLR